MKYFSTSDLMKILTEKMKEDYPSNQIFCQAFPQLWGSTALGYDGIGGSAMTTADTIIIFINNGPVRVYFASDKLAYEIKNPNNIFWKDVYSRNLRPQGEENIYEKETEQCTKNCLNG